LIFITERAGTTLEAPPPEYEREIIKLLVEENKSMHYFDWNM